MPLDPGPKVSPAAHWSADVALFGRVSSTAMTRGHLFDSISTRWRWSGAPARLANPSLRPVSSAQLRLSSGKQVNALIPNGGSIQRQPSHAWSWRG
ncbi:hypothetical protein GOODEAATRI_017960 [Goodea atripinnis]|uniref:Uncharacterized protein n=1 Tax=Goodea atripinnis TaxID=208336 RepID=A0ABV0MUF3_9TELE